MGNIGTMTVALKMDSRDLESGVKGAQSSIDGMVNKLSKVGGVMTGAVTLPILGVAAAAVKLSSDLNASMANIGSLGIGTDRLKEMKSAIQDLSIETGASTSDIADGMYQVVSAFGDGADSLKILRINAKAAKAGLATLPETLAMTSAVTKAWGDTSAEAVQHVADLGLKTVELGQTTLPELATSMQGITLMSKSLNITQEEMFAVMAAGTGTIGSAADVATKLRGAEQALMVPNANMIAAFKAMGVESGAALIKSKGLGGAFQSLQGYLNSTGGDFTDLIGSVEGLQFAMFMSGAGADLYTDKLAALQDSAGKTDAAFLAQTQGINKVGFTMEKLQRYAEVLGQKIGDALAPALATLLDRVTPLADELVKLVDGFVKMDPATQNWAVAGFALLAALGPILMILPGIASAVGMVSGAVAALSGPIGWAILAVAGLGIAWAYNWGDIQGKTKAAIDAMRPYFDQLMGWIDTLTGSSMAAPKLPALPGASLGVSNKPALPGASLMPSGNAVAVAGKAMESSGIVGTLDQINTSASGASTSVSGLVGILGQLSAKGNPFTEIQTAMAATWKDLEGLPARIQALWTEFNKPITVGGNIPAAVLAWWNDWKSNAAALIEIWNPPFTVGGNIPQSVLTWWTEWTTNAAALIANWSQPITVGGNVTKSVLDWWNNWKAGAAEALKTWQPVVDVLGKWVPISLPGMKVELNDAFTDPVEIKGSWYAPTLPFLWDALQNTFDEPVMIVGSWFSNALSDLWESAQSWFTSKPINLGVNFTTSQAGVAGTGFIDVNPPMPQTNVDLSTGKIIPPKARGGPVSSGVPYLVGERGAELFVPNMSGRIIPNDELGEYGGITVNNYGALNNQIDLNALAYAVAGQLKRRN